MGKIIKYQEGNLLNKIYNFKKGVKEVYLVVSLLNCHGSFLVFWVNGNWECTFDVFIPKKRRHMTQAISYLCCRRRRCHVVFTFYACCTHLRDLPDTLIHAVPPCCAAYASYQPHAACGLRTSTAAPSASGTSRLVETPQKRWATQP